MHLPRGLVFVDGTSAETRLACLSCLEGQDPDEVLWLSATPEPLFVNHALRRVAEFLGRGFDAVVVDLHDELPVDGLVASLGFLRGGGRLLVRVPSGGAEPAFYGRDLALWPFDRADVGRRMWRRLIEAFGRSTGRVPAEPFPRPDPRSEGTVEQAVVVAALTAGLLRPRPSTLVLLSRRGRGKSSAIGLALYQLGPRRVALISDHDTDDEATVSEVRRFADSVSLKTYRPDHRFEGEESPEIIIVDEAARLPLAVLSALVLRNPGTHLVFATTVDGYEGSGRGFELRFIDFLRANRPDVEVHRISCPIRFADADPLETLFDEVLLLDATPARVNAAGAGPREPSFERLSRPALDRHPTDLRDLYALLRFAHHRTTPADLHRLLDAPNLSLFASRLDGRIVAACLVAAEGGLPPELCNALDRGAQRIRGHALPDTLISHAGLPEAGALRWARSVRIATHPDLRRRGLASRLVEEVHAQMDVDAFGTLFAATEALLTFRRALGYRLVRLSVSRGARSGEPSVVMVRPVSPAAVALVETLEHELPHVLRAQLRYLQADSDLPLNESLIQSLFDGLPQRPLEAWMLDRAVHRYLDGPRPFETSAFAILPWVQAHRGPLAALDDRSRKLITARVLEAKSYAEAASLSGFLTTAAAMRALRPALARLHALVSDAAHGP
ncbi:MAG: tRNA(Met) cytidine acetyltransferase [Myxococcales bacterium]|nr:tRNA(Met) cytidine acetyltransferase [Myxococcales bacterium]